MASTKAIEKEVSKETRDYAAEMNKIIQLMVSTKKTYTSVGLAHDLVRRLRRTDPDLLQGWLELQAEELLREHISRLSRSQRAHNRRVSSRAAFGQAVREYADSGDPKTITSWLDCSYTVDENNTKMTLGEMTSTELSYAAEFHQKLADTNEFEARFLSALARKVGDSKVGDFYTEEQLLEMRSGLQKMLGKTRRR